MKTIGLLSDTHNHLDDKFFNFFEPCHQIWHAGDIGTLELADKISAFRPLTAVYGNIDGTDLRQVYPQFLRFEEEGMDILMTHIGGYPGKYNPSVLKIFKTNPPKLFVCGHSHILRVMYDHKYDLLTINPGAAGRYGQQPKRTAVRFVLNNGEISNLEILELPK